jgi:hypothetical protein
MTSCEGLSLACLVQSPSLCTDGAGARAEPMTCKLKDHHGSLGKTLLQGPMLSSKFISGCVGRIISFWD